MLVMGGSCLKLVIREAWEVNQFGSHRVVSIPAIHQARLCIPPVWPMVPEVPQVPTSSSGLPAQWGYEDRLQMRKCRLLYPSQGTLRGGQCIYTLVAWRANSLLPAPSRMLPMWRQAFQPSPPPSVERADPLVSRPPPSCFSSTEPFLSPWSPFLQCPICPPLARLVPDLELGLSL